VAAVEAAAAAVEVARRNEPEQFWASVFDFERRLLGSASSLLI